MIAVRVPRSRLPLLRASCPCPQSNLTQFPQRKAAPATNVRRNSAGSRCIGEKRIRPEHGWYGTKLNLRQRIVLCHVLQDIPCQPSKSRFALRLGLEDARYRLGVSEPITAVLQPGPHQARTTCRGRKRVDQFESRLVISLTTCGIGMGINAGRHRYRGTGELKCNAHEDLGQQDFDRFDRCIICEESLRSATRPA